MRSDVKLEKSLDLMLNELREIEGVEECPIYEWLNDFRIEVAEENIANLKTEIPVPSFDEEVCEDCPMEE